MLGKRWVTAGGVFAGVVASSLLYLEDTNATEKQWFADAIDKAAHNNSAGKHGSLSRSIDVVLYPFGGADVSSALAAFPAISVLFLCGLEAVHSRQNQGLLPWGATADAQSMYADRDASPFQRGTFHITEDLQKFTEKHGVVALLKYDIETQLSGRLLSVEYGDSGRGVDLLVSLPRRRPLRVKYISLDIMSTEGGVNTYEKIVDHTITESGPVALILKATMFLARRDAVETVLTHVATKVDVVLQDVTGLDISLLSPHFSIFSLGDYRLFHDSSFDGIYSSAALAAAFKQTKSVGRNAGLGERRWGTCYYHGGACAIILAVSPSYNMNESFETRPRHYDVPPLRRENLSVSVSKN